MWFQRIGLWVTLPLWLVAEGLTVYAALEFFHGGNVRPDLLLVAGFLGMLGLVAFFVGYALRDA